MLLLIFLIAALNLGLGFAAAMVLGWGPPGLTEAWLAMTAGPIAETGSDAWRVPLPAPLVGPPAPIPGDSSAVAAAPVTAPPEAAPAELWNLDEAFVETSLLKLNVAMLRSGVRTTEIDSRLRAGDGQPNRETIQHCLAQLSADCESYLAEQSAAAEKFSARLGELGELRSLGEQIETDNLNQAAQIETTLSNLRHMDFASEPAAAAARLLQEIHNLCAARHKLRDSQEAAFLAVARRENRLAHIEPRLGADPLTRLPNRIGLETALAAWWEEGRPKKRQVTAALLDLDAFAQLNETHGLLVGDKVLYHVGQLLRGAAGPADLAGRFGGQRFLLTMMDAGPRNAVKQTETLRQQVEKLAFVSGPQRFGVTLSAGVAEVRPEDSFEAVVTRLERALDQAKQSGRNRGCLANGSRIEPIAAPNLGAQPAEIAL